jgi:hypothetical protein
VEGDIIAATAALADTAGFIVVETDHSWTAIETKRQFWSEAPGAHRRWNAGIKRSDPRYGGIDIFWIQYQSAKDPRQIKAYQGRNGWRVTTFAADKTPAVTFTHQVNPNSQIAA